MARQVALNRSSRWLWVGYQQHRERATSLLLNAMSAYEPRPRIALLGAGNLNDVDLKAVLAAEPDLHLYDVDSWAMRFGLQRQGISPQEVTLHEVDLLLASSLGEFDLVVSSNILSQLIDQACGDQETSPIAIRDSHVSLVSRSLVPGGTALFSLDVVSSETVEGLASLPRDVLPDLMIECIESGNFFSGCNPFAMARSIDLRTSEQVAKVCLPWRWHLGDRTYLCSAVLAKSARWSAEPAS